MNVDWVYSLASVMSQLRGCVLLTVVLVFLLQKALTYLTTDHIFTCPSYVFTFFETNFIEYLFHAKLSRFWIFYGEKLYASTI